jgi:hypothetical protein
MPDTLVAQFGRLLALLADGGVEVVVIGGLAGAVHGAARATYDVDVVYRRTPENLGTLAAGLNFTLTTDAGPLDLLGEVLGGGFYEDLAASAASYDLAGATVLVASLDDLIAMKRAAGRPKDLEVVAELETIRDERGTP